MGQSAEEFVNQLLTKEALEKPSDTGKLEQLKFELPEWFDEAKFNQGRKFYWHHVYSFSMLMLMGLVAVFAVPSILAVLSGSRRSSSVYTAYKRYVATILHITSWVEHELKPKSKSWKSLYTVRSRHLRATLVSKMRGGGVVSQRDVALTQFGLIGFAILKPDKFGIRQVKEGDWEAYNHYWRVIGYMLGLEDRYNICRPTFDETREVSKLLLERVYTPALENVPEYFEHMARVMLDGLGSVIPGVDIEAVLYFSKYLADVPGYIYYEHERIELVNKMKELLKGKPLKTGVESTALMSKWKVDGLPVRPPRLLYLRDYETIDNSPEYKKLNLYSRFRLFFTVLSSAIYTTYIGRVYYNLNFLLGLLLMKYFPYLAFFRFGIKASLVNIFEDSPMDNTNPKPNEEFYKKSKTPWYREWLAFLW